jgi:hypothetical protein
MQRGIADMGAFGAVATRWTVEMTSGASPPPDEDGGRPNPRQDEGRGNIVALVFVVALAIGGYWLFRTLERHGEIQACLASGRRDCIEFPHSEPSP